MTPAPPAPTIDDVGWYEMDVLARDGNVVKVRADLGFRIKRDYVLMLDYEITWELSPGDNVTAKIRPGTIGTGLNHLVVARPEDEAQLYVYDIVVTDNYDGDTVTADFLLAPDVSFSEKRIRLHRIDTAELRGEERPDGLVAKAFTESRLVGLRHLARSNKDRTGKYGRYLLDIYESSGCFNDVLVEEGYAEYVNY